MHRAPICFHHGFGNFQFHEHLRNTDFEIRVVLEDNASKNEDYLNKNRPLNKPLGICTSLQSIFFQLGSTGSYVKYLCICSLK